MKIAIVIFFLTCVVSIPSCKSADLKPVRDCKKNCLSLYGECIESCRTQQPPGEAGFQRQDNSDYHNQIMMSGCAGRCDDMKKKCYSDCDNYRVFENNGAPEK